MVVLASGPLNPMLLKAPNGAAKFTLRETVPPLALEATI